MIKAIIFDLFETLITESKHKPPQGPSVAERLGMDEQVFRAEWRKRQKDRMTGVFPDYASAVVDTCNSLGHKIDHSLISQIEQDRITGFTRIFTDPDPDVINALREIRRLNVTLGLISNASPDEVTAWDTCQLSSLMDTSVFSCRVGCMKPGPEIYLITCQRLGVDPRECIYIGDGSFGELPGAAELGMTTYCATWFRDRWPEDTHPVEAGMFVKLGSLGELRTAIERAMTGKERKCDT